jgi:hypothetical protein
MKERDIREFDEFERELLDGSFNPTAVYKRMRTIVVLSVMVAGLVVAFATWKPAIPILTIVFVAYVAVVTAEKLSYSYTILRFESLVRKLVRRIEALEGVRLTPDRADRVSIAHSHESAVEQRH